MLKDIQRNYVKWGNIGAARAVGERITEIAETSFSEDAFEEALEYVKEVFRFGHEIYASEPILKRLQELKKDYEKRVLGHQLSKYFQMIEGGEIRREFWREQMGAYVGETIDKIAEKLGETSDEFKRALQNVKDEIVNKLDDFDYESMVKD